MHAVEEVGGAGQWVGLEVVGWEEIGNGRSDLSPLCCTAPLFFTFVHRSIQETEYHDFVIEL